MWAETRPRRQRDKQLTVLSFLVEGSDVASSLTVLSLVFFPDDDDLEVIPGGLAVCINLQTWKFQILLPEASKEQVLNNYLHYAVSLQAERRYKPWTVEHWKVYLH